MSGAQGMVMISLTEAGNDAEPHLVEIRPFLGACVRPFTRSCCRKPRASRKERDNAAQSAHYSSVRPTGPAARRQTDLPDPEPTLFAPTKPQPQRFHNNALAPTGLGLWKDGIQPMPCLSLFDAVVRLMYADV